MAVKKTAKKTLKTGEKKRTAARAKKGEAYEFSSLNSKLSPSEVLSVAIKSEIESAVVYLRLYRKEKNEILRIKLKFLVSEEKKHRQILERLFSQRFPREELKILEKSFLPPIKISRCALFLRR